MGILTLDGQYVGDRPFRSFGRGDVGQSTAFDAYAMACAKVTVEDLDAALAFAAKAYRIRLAEAADKAYQEKAKAERAETRKESW